MMSGQIVTVALFEEEAFGGERNSVRRDKGQLGIQEILSSRNEEGSGGMGIIVIGLQHKELTDAGEGLKGPLYTFLIPSTKRKEIATTLS